MIYEEKPNGLRVLRPSDNQHKLRGYDTTYDEEGNEIVDYYDVIYLGKYQNQHDYYEVSVYDIEGYEFKSELAKFEADMSKKNEEDDERDSLIIDLAVQMSILKLTM